DLRVLRQDLDGAIEDRLGLGLDDVLVGVEVDALEDAGEIFELLGHDVGAAFVVLEAVAGLGLGRALVLDVGDAVLVVVGRTAGRGRSGLARALVVAIGDAVAVAVAQRLFFFAQERDREAEQ